MGRSPECSEEQAGWDDTHALLNGGTENEIPEAGQGSHTGDKGRGWQGRGRSGVLGHQHPTAHLQRAVKQIGAGRGWVEKFSANNNEGRPGNRLEGGAGPCQRFATIESAIQQSQ